eukprot:753799-Hanusia_phi.AAC.5
MAARQPREEQRRGRRRGGEKSRVSLRGKLNDNYRWNATSRAKKTALRLLLALLPSSPLLLLVFNGAFQGSSLSR